ncbi:MAG: hypothetical protein ACTHKG_21940, partial [Nocardioides sp.]
GRRARAVAVRGYDEQRVGRAVELGRVVELGESVGQRLGLGVAVRVGVGVGESRRLIVSRQNGHIGSA